MAEETKKTFSSSFLKGDNYLWIIYILLIGISIVEMFSASSRLAYKAASNSGPAADHLQKLVLGFFALLIFQRLPLKSLVMWDKIFLLSGIALAFSLPFLGREINGAKRDIIGMQPVEFCKVGLMMFLCWAITAKDELYYQFKIFRSNTQLRRFYFLLICIGITSLPIAMQNLSSALILGMSSMAVMFLGGIRIKYLLITIGLAGAVGLTAYGSLYALHEVNISRQEQGLGDVNLGPLNRANTWERRIFAKDERPLWEENLNGEKAQVLQAKLALANSYPFGKFVGNSQLRDHLPEAYSDYIFAIIFEEWGALGASFVVFLYLALLYRCYKLSTRTENPYIRLMIISLPLIMVIQALIHVGVCTDAMFVTGQPLPFISRGGSSIIFISISYGIILALSRLIEIEVKQRNAEKAFAAEVKQE